MQHAQLGYTQLAIEFSNPNSDYAEYVERMFVIVQPHLRGKTALSVAEIRGPSPTSDFSERRFSRALTLAHAGKLEGIIILCGRSSSIYTEIPQGVDLNIGIKKSWYEGFDALMFSARVLIGHHFVDAEKLREIRQQLENLFFEAVKHPNALLAWYLPNSVYNRRISQQTVDLLTSHISEMKYVYVANSARDAVQRVIGAEVLANVHPHSHGVLRIMDHM